MRYGKHDAALVDLSCAANGVGVPRVAETEKARKIVLVVFDGLAQHLHVIDRCGKLRADGSVALESESADSFGCTGRVVGFYNLAVAKLLEKVTALHEGYRVGIDFPNVVDVLVGQTKQTVLNVELVLTYNGEVAGTQQFVIVEQAACDGIFNGHHGQQAAVFLHGVEKFFKCFAANQLNLFVGEELVGGNIVERTLDTLYGYFLHVNIFLIKNPARVSGTFMFSICICAYRLPLHFLLGVK